MAGWFRVIVFFIERNFLLQKKVLYFVYGLRNAVQKFLWLGWVLLAWILILDKKVEKETDSRVLRHATRILICLMVTTLVWLVKTLLVKVLEMNFHVKAFFDRIQDALFSQYVIEVLSGPPYIEEEDKVNNESSRGGSSCGKSPRIVRSKSLNRKDEGDNSVGIRIDHLHKLNQKNVSAWSMKRLMTIARKGVLSTLDEKLDSRVD